MAYTRRKAVSYTVLGCAGAALIGVVVVAILVWDASPLRVIGYVCAALGGAYLSLILDYLIEESDVTGRMLDGQEYRSPGPVYPRDELPEQGGPGDAQ